MAGAPHMTPDEFRARGHQVVEWVASYMERVGELPIAPSVKPGEIRAKLPPHAPEEPEPFEALLRDLDEVVLPGITHWQAPGWFSYFPANASPPSILAELVSAGLGAQGMLWSSSPALTEIEAHVLDWLVDLLGLPEHFKTANGPGGGVIQMSASDSTHLVHVVARDEAIRAGAPRDGLVAYGSLQAHSSVERGANIAGFAHVRKLDVDERFALRPRALDEAIAADRASGLHPTIVTSAIGTTGTGAVDPIAAVADIAREHGLWHHVDAAWAGSAMLCEEHRGKQAGAERADSYTFNPHKWLFTNFDCNVLWVADRAPLLASLSILPPYLRNAASESGEVIDYRDWHVSLGRRFRALKLWWVLRSYGAQNLRSLLREHMALAEELDGRVGAHPRLERVAPVSFALVCFRHADGNEATDALADAVNAEPTLAVTPSTVGDTRFVRVAIGQTRTTAADVERLWRVIDAAA
jgi:aromatic-L-amino-acid decarboxylase